MCCIFTCCGWMIDLIQRAWVFAMSCCISSAVCCVLITSSMSGVALGYNYSLAEYIDLKETNVSIYLKRGVFDDDVADDMEWRRSGGHKPIKGFVRDDGDLKTGAPEEEDSSLRSGRRLDDSILESNSQNKFEGSLMKLTAKPIQPLTTNAPATSNEKTQDIFQKYPQGSLDQLKEIQSLINMRKSEAVRETTMSNAMKMSTYAMDDRYIPQFPAFPNQARRMMGGNGPGQGPGQPDFMDTFALPGVNPARFAVPDSAINEQIKWMGPKIPERKAMDYNLPREYPSPIVYNPGPIRPTRPEGPAPTHTSSEKVVTVNVVEVSTMKSIDKDMEEFKEKLILDKYESPRLNEPDKTDKEGEMKSGFDYYSDDVKGLPVRRKRSNNVRKNTKINNSKLRHEKDYGHKHLKLIEKSSPNKINHFPNHSMRKLLSFQNPAFESVKSEKNGIRNEQKPKLDLFEDESVSSVPRMNNIRVRRKNKRALHEKLVTEMGRKVEENSINKRNVKYPGILVGELLFHHDNPPRTSAVTENVNNINFTTDNIVSILRSMFS